ncbi:hypothetical protein Nans01_40870 [Nocardiopsis ansamitocini]|uniref:Uncharacterized protein n=1 Tax=Nocardiopsis ansamitocini TaxID=1670832 RepID=A0A9W6P9S6_9ACTN|nr:hypothetical protein Nans01_40870 [Nocardiopsis ansamitocini]
MFFLVGLLSAGSASLLLLVDDEEPTAVEIPAAGPYSASTACDLLDPALSEEFLAEGEPMGESARECRWVVPAAENDVQEPDAWIVLGFTATSEAEAEEEFADTVRSGQSDNPPDRVPEHRTGAETGLGPDVDEALVQAGTVEPDAVVLELRAANVTVRVNVVDKGSTDRGRLEELSFALAEAAVARLER